MNDAAAAEDPQALVQRGNEHYAQEKLEDAAACYRRALDLAPDHADARHNLGSVLHRQRRHAEAEACYRTALTLHAGREATYANLAEVLREQDRPEEAIAAYRAAVALRSDRAVTHNNMGSCHMALARPAQAIPCFRAALTVDPEYAVGHYNLGSALLMHGELAEGWQEFEWRWSVEPARNAQRTFAQPQWRGEPAAGQTLLVHAEQGLGDTLQFCRFVPLVAERGLRVIVEAPPHLVRLLHGLRGIDRVVTRGETLPDFDRHCPMLSLPLALGITLDSIPANTPYLSADAAQAAAWRDRLVAEPFDGPRVGLVWSGGLRPDQALAAAMDRRRSMSPRQLAPLFLIPGIQFFSLQKAGPQAPADFPLVDHMAEMQDFADTAALVANLDLVISVDTAMVHLAGALGRPVWMLDRFDHCWRWLEDRHDSPWYPLLRIYRQPNPGNWDAAVAQLARDLQALSDVWPRAQPLGQSNAAAVAPEPAPSRFQVALALHQAGRLAEAAQLYRQIIADDPRHADSQHLLGVVASQTNNHAAAVDLIGAAIAIAPDTALYHANLAVSLLQLGHTEAAAEACRRAVTRQPDFAQAHRTLGEVAEQRGRSDEAEASYRTALDLNPHDAAAWSSLGNLLFRQDRADEAAACYRTIIAMRPDDADAHANLGLMLLQQRHLAAAETHCRQAIALNETCDAAHAYLGDVLRDQFRVEEAIASYRRAIALKPNRAATLNKLAAAHLYLGQAAEARDCCLAALALEPDFLHTRNNLGVAHLRLGQAAEAIATLRGVIHERPDYAEAHNNLALSLLCAGDMADGWAEYEWRWRVEPGRRHRRDFPQPQWRGEPGEGRTLLIHAEQGYGDTVQFCRYAPLARARGWRVIVETPRTLQRLLQTLAGVDGLIVPGDALPAFDMHCPMLSLPAAFGTTVETVPANIPYLAADPAQAGAWRARLDDATGRRPRVGLVWSGSTMAAWTEGRFRDQRRSIPPERLGPLLDVPGVAFVSLQKDGPPLPAGLPVLDPMAEMRDFADTAALVANLDLVISVDTAVAHLAGALGRRVWLLDRFDHCWRWLNARRDSPWYPRLRIYRQRTPNDWDPVLAAAAEDLRGLVRNPR